MHIYKNNNHYYIITISKWSPCAPHRIMNKKVQIISQHFSLVITYRQRQNFLYFFIDQQQTYSCYEGCLTNQILPEQLKAIYQNIEIIFKLIEKYKEKVIDFNHQKKALFMKFVQQQRIRYFSIVIKQKNINKVQYIGLKISQLQNQNGTIEQQILRIESQKQNLIQQSSIQKHKVLDLTNKINLAIAANKIAISTSTIDMVKRYLRQINNLKNAIKNLIEVNEQHSNIIVKLENSEDYQQQPRYRRNSLVGKRIIENAFCQLMNHLKGNIYLNTVKNQINQGYFEWVENKIGKVKSEQMKILYFEPMLTFQQTNKFCASFKIHNGRQYPLNIGLICDRFVSLSDTTNCKSCIYYDVTQNLVYDCGQKVILQNKIIFLPNQKITIMIDGIYKIVRWFLDSILVGEAKIQREVFYQGYYIFIEMAKPKTMISINS